MKRYGITPRTWHRMTQHSKHTPAAKAYHRWMEDLQKLGIEIPDSGASIQFVMPIAKSRSKKDHLSMPGTPHQQRPDLSNLLKAVEDAARYGKPKGDQTIWSYGKLSKVWGPRGYIIVYDDSVFDYKGDG